MSKFRKVKPLVLDDVVLADEEPVAEVELDTQWASICGIGFNVDEARALRDWLTSTLPKVKP
jgi:hypothetical protein